MFTVELYAKVRHAVMIEGLSRREAAKRFGIHRNTITKMLSFSVPPGYRRRERPVSKKLGPYVAWIDAILEGDRNVHKKQRHTAHRIFERLRDEQGFTGGYTIVREYVAAAMLRTREMFVPLSHRPGHAQADFGEADGSQVRGLLSIPRSNSARSRTLRNSWRLTRIAQISFSLNGAFWPTSLPLFHGSGWGRTTASSMVNF